MNKAKCSQAGRALVKKQTSQVGRALAQCRWGKKSAPKKKTAPKKKATAAPRKSRRQAGLAAETVRQPEPKKKPRKKAVKKKAGGKSSTGLKKVENILVPGINPKKGDMKSFLAEQQRIWG